MASRRMNRGSHKSGRHRIASGNDLVFAEKLDIIARVAETASHKVNNFLTPVLNYVFILKNSAADENTLSLLSKIEGGVNKARDVVQGIADPARPAMYTLEKMDLKRELDIVMDAFLSSSRTSGVELTRRLRGSGSVIASKKGLYVLVSSLLMNAVEAGARDIRVSCRRIGDDFVISITDNGQGIGRETLKLAFEPFFTTKPGHQGLGLYLCHHIVRSFGGFIACRSREGKESRFTIILPAA